MPRRKKKDDDTSVQEIENEKKNAKTLSRSSSRTKRRKIDSLDEGKGSSDLKTKSSSVETKSVNTIEESSKISVLTSSKTARVTRKAKTDIGSEPKSKNQPANNKRPKCASKKSKLVENEPKLKKSRVVFESTAIKREVDHSQNGNIKCKVDCSKNKDIKQEVGHSENEDIKQEVDYSKNENCSGSSVHSGCSSEVTLKVDKSSANTKSIKAKTASCSNNLSSSGIADDLSSSESEWEEVEENDEQTLENYNPVIPKEGVEITIDCPNLKFKRCKKKEFDEMEYIRLYVNRMRKEVQLNVHKCHLLILLAIAHHANNIINSSFLQAIALSLIPTNILDWTKGKKVDKMDIDGIEKIVKWFRNSFSYETKKDSFLNLHADLVKSFEIRTALNASEYNIMLIIILRVLGFKARLCTSLYPLSHKASNLIKKRKKKGDETSKTTNCDDVKCKLERENMPTSAVKPKKESVIKHKSQKKDKCNGKKDDISGHLDKDKQNSKNENKLPSGSKTNKESVSKQKSREKNKAPAKAVRKASTGKNYKISSEDESADNVDEEFKMEENFKKPKVYRKSSKKTTKQRSNREILSDSDSDDSSTPLYACYHPEKVLYWAEVFAKPDKQWTSVECVHGILNDPYEIEAILPQPVSYVLAIDNDCYVKDLTKRYCRNYMTFNIKLRVVSEWWDETLIPFAPPNSKLDKEEEKNLESTLINQPLPTTVSGLKNHPLYALKRHLLKFEAIYPPDAASVGFIRGEPIYLRENVCQLHSRETWLKEARVVRIGEEPYKIVKARPKWDKIAGVVRTDLPLEIFGFWQTEPYEPPIAVDGKVPRNEYGNVELFKPCMLPRGTVHIQLPGINRIAKKLGIDCSPAVVGFDGHKGSIHPVFDGFVVCEEFKETIIIAWDEEQENIRKRDEEKREKRIYGNWKRLIKGLLIRERIKLKYDMHSDNIHECSSNSSS